MAEIKTWRERIERAVFLPRNCAERDFMQAEIDELRAALEAERAPLDSMADWATHWMPLPPPPGPTDVADTRRPVLLADGSYVMRDDSTGKEWSTDGSPIRS